MAVGPKRLTLRAYGVGFGDCFLLTFHYGGGTGERHVLIDFGSTQKPPNPRRNLLSAIAEDIATVTNGHLDVVVATHRHTDHVSGFATRNNGKGPGNRIANLNPSLVVQPWTERPDAPRNWTGKGAVADGVWTSSLTLMREVAAASLSETRHLSPALREEIQFVAKDGLSNLSAVKNLAQMGKKTAVVYASHGTRLPLAKLLPGVSVKVLGPPTLAQKSDIVNQKATNREEYWHFHSFWQLRANTTMLKAGTALFPRAATYGSRDIPPESRWFIWRLRQARGEQLLRIVRAMDDALNNTSLILLIKAGAKKFLFPGDAQWENWEYAIQKNRSELRNVDFYKVGHHGSLNATPRTLWQLFSHRGNRRTPRRLTTLASTRSNSKHGSRANNTEVPRETLVAELRKNSNFRSTQELEGSGRLALQLIFRFVGKHERLGQHCTSNSPAPLNGITYSSESHPRGIFIFRDRELRSAWPRRPVSQNP